MNSLLLLVPISLVLLGIALWAFAWAVRRGQFDDLDTPALDILVESEPGSDDLARVQPLVPQPQHDAAAPVRRVSTPSAPSADANPPPVAAPCSTAARAQPDAD